MIVMSDEPIIGKLRIIPTGVSVICKDRVCVDSVAYCTRDTGVAIEITDKGVKYSPLCSRDQCVTKL